jgi:hypothetical protein
MWEKKASVRNKIRFAIGTSRIKKGRKLPFSFQSLRRTSFFDTTTRNNKDNNHQSYTDTG